MKELISNQYPKELLVSAIPKGEHFKMDKPE